MFATEWGKKNRVNKKDDFSFVKKVSGQVWAEHCIECAVPYCFGTCEKYRKRRDGKCRLFNDGISRNKGNGLLGYSVTISFEGWSKLEATYRPRQHRLFIIKMVDFFSLMLMKFGIGLSKLFEKKHKIWSISSFMYKVREGFSAILNKYGGYPDALLIDINNDDKELELIIEIKNVDQVSFFKNSYHISNGNDRIVIPFEDIRIVDNKKSFIFLYPSSDTALTFNVLDFVTFKKSYKNEMMANVSKNIDVHKKIKCVAWDLDNTLWDGVLIEGKVTLKEEVISLIKELDERGIVNSIVSKNDYQEAMDKLKEFGVNDYFVFPQISWNPKSEAIKNLAKSMNIGIDAICFVDDSPFELEEVSYHLKGVICIDAKNYKAIEKLDCFNTKITEDSKSRRKTYQMKEKETLDHSNWIGDIESFLRSCDIKIKITKPSENEYDRCFELMQRTNQLNSSGRRLSREEIMNLINSDNIESFVIKCQDKYGNYGTVGFSLFDKKINTITDFVISCRVANKTIEQTFIQYVVKHYSSNGIIYMHYKKTDRNGPIYNVLKDLNMIETSNTDELSIMKYDNSICKKYDIVEIV